jgi:hypothetical protein
LAKLTNTRSWTTPGIGLIRGLVRAWLCQPDLDPPEYGGQYGEGQTLTSLGQAYQEMRQPDRAAMCWREAAAAMHDVGDHEEAGRLEQLAVDAQAPRRRW